MSKMGCRCGGIISDRSPPCATEGFILRDEDLESYHDAIGRDIEAFLNAISENQRNDWIVSYFSSVYPTDLSDQNIILDIISIHERHYSLSIAECEKFGRLHLQKERGLNSYRSYLPDEGGYAGVLRSAKRRSSGEHSANAAPTLK